MIQIIKIIFICFLSILNSGVFAGHNAYTKMESETACAIARSASLLSYAGFLQPTFMRTCPAVSLFSEMAGEGARLLFSQLSRCSFDASSTTNFAKHFTIEVFSPGGKKEIFNGLEFLKKCRTQNTKKLKCDQLICLMHGWQIKCSESKIFANWGERDAPVLADNYDAMVYVISWPACCNYFEIIHCYWHSITHLIAVEFLIKGAQNNQHPSLDGSMLIGHSLGGQLVGHIGRIIFKQTGQLCKLICALDPAGPGFETKFTRGELQGMHKNVAEQTFAVHTDPNRLGTGTDLCLAKYIIICKGLENYPQSSISTPAFKHLFACNEFMYKFARNISMNATRDGDSCHKIHTITLYDKMVPGRYVFNSKYNPEVSRNRRTPTMKIFGSFMNSWF